MNRAAAAWLALLCALALGGTPLPAVSAGRSEIWLTADRGRGEERGTQDAPFIVRTADAFDARMRGTSPNTTIHLLPGIYETKGGTADSGGFAVKNGWTIRGAGMGRTTVRLVGCVRDKGGGTAVGRAFFSGWGDGVTNVLLTDLTVDANGPGVARVAGTDRLSTEGVRLMGRDLRLERVHAIRAVGRRNAPGVNPESFILGIGTRTATDRHGSFEILSCKVSDFVGGACTAIAIYGPDDPAALSGGLIRSNHVQLNGQGSDVGLGAYGDGIVVERNEVTGAARAFNWDTPKHGRGTIIRSNVFLGCIGYALCLGGGTDGLVEGNVIEVVGDTAVAVLLSARNDVLPGASRWVIRGNILKARSGRPGATAFYRDSIAPGCVFENNIMDPAFELRGKPEHFARWRGNRQPDGRER